MKLFFRLFKRWYIQIPWATSGYIFCTAFSILLCLSEIIKIPSLHPKVCLIFLKNHSQNSLFSESIIEKARGKILPLASYDVAESSVPLYVPVRNVPSTTTISL